MYKLDTADISDHKALVAADMRMWHNRLAHVHPDVIANMADAEIGTGLSLKKSSSDNFKCFGCVLGKGHRAPIPKKVANKTSQLLELVHSDVNGPIEVPSQGGSRYFVTFIDDFSRWTTVYTMKQKIGDIRLLQRSFTHTQRNIRGKEK